MTVAEYFGPNLLLIAARVLNPISRKAIENLILLVWDCIVDLENLEVFWRRNGYGDCTIWRAEGLHHLCEEDRDRCSTASGLHEVCDGRQQA